MSVSVETDICQIIEEIAPHSVLLIDLKQNGDWLEGTGKFQVDLIGEGDLIKQIESFGTRDLAILMNTLEYLEKTIAGNVLARLRDIYSRRLLVLVPVENTPAGNNDRISHWNDADLIAYGMRQLTEYENGCHLYEYNIVNYKNIPDWLNAKNWANPELWGKFRW